MRHMATTVGLTLAVAAAIALVAPATKADARSYVYNTEYCARDYDGAMDCSYFTLKQCLAGGLSNGWRLCCEPALFRRAGATLSARAA